MIKTHDFVRVIADKRMKGSGLFRGQLLFIIGTKVAPVSKDDPYLQRIYVLAIRVGEDGKLQVPGEGNDYRSYLVDPRNVEKLNEQEVEDLRDTLN